MFALVYPLKRMPRRFGFFDYRVPQGMVVHVGDIVKIPFRKSILNGVVCALQETSSFKRVAPIESVAWPQYFLERDVRRIERIADVLALSPSQIFFTALIGFDKAPKEIESRRSNLGDDSLAILKIEAEIIAKTLKEKTVFAHLSIEGQFALSSVAQKHTKDQLLILCPNARIAEQLHAFLPHTSLLHGKTTPGQRRFILEGWRNGAVKTLIGTMQASLISPHKLVRVIVVSSENDDYRYLNRNPRIGIPQAGELLALSHDADFIVTDHYPAIDERPSILQTLPEMQVIPVDHEAERTNQFFITNTLTKAIENTLQSGKNVLCSFNRKSSEAGIGNKEIADYFRRTFPGYSIEIADETHRATSANILLATEYYFKHEDAPFAKKNFGLIAEMNADLSLGGADYRASQMLGWKLARLAFIAKREGAECIVQTFEPDLVKQVLRIETFLQSERALRKSYKLPPYFDRYNIECPDDASRQTAKEINDYKQLPDSCIVEADLATYVPQTSAPQFKPGIE